MPENVMIGLEIHVQLNTLESKMFCPCTTDYHDDPPNTHTCPVCLGLPGSMPVINEEAVDSAIKVALALNCDIQPHTQFYRKNYFYPDLPKGFQITQYDYPIGTEGRITIEIEDREREIGITRVHMEEDPGRLVHAGTIDRSKYSLIDYNRSGMALLEVVTEPDLKSPKEARRFLNKLRTILEYLGVFDGDLEGSLRVDANVSIEGGARTEIKNISSYKGAQKALLYEISRQRNQLRRGKEIVQETRHYDEERGITIGLRTKEEAQDYRYFPEPDLVPLRVEDRVPRIKETLPELPDARRERFTEQYGLSEEHARALTSDIMVADYYEEVVDGIDPTVAATWVSDVLKGELNYRDKSIGEAFPPGQMREVIELLEGERVTEKGAVTVIRALLDEGGTPKEIMEEKGLEKAGENVVEGAVEEAIRENPGAVEDYQGGKEEALNYLVGQVMKKTRGRASPAEANELLRERL